jgi:acyl-coenzyme A synthetase/AMP-(fatty) acid ligase
VVVGSVDLHALDAHVAARLAPHKRPRLWTQAPELPQTPMGKIDRRAAAQRFGAALKALAP